MILSLAATQKQGTVVIQNITASCTVRMGLHVLHVLLHNILETDKDAILSFVPCIILLFTHLLRFLKS